MDGFEFVFTLFGLLLGFSLVEVLAGFARAIEAGMQLGQTSSAPRSRIGWLSPLLGLFVILNLVSFWTGAWSLRDVIPVNYPALMFGLAVTGGYYFAAFLVFPRDPLEWTDLDEHYFRVKRWVVAVVILCNALGSAGALMVANDPPNVVGGLIPNLFFYGALAALFILRGHRINIALLAVVIVQYPLSTLIVAVT